MLRCRDGSYYTGVTNNLEERLSQHHHGYDPRSYTYDKRPLELVWSEECSSPGEAIAREKQIQGWSRKKKEGLIGGDWEKMHLLAMNRKNRASTRASTGEDSSVA